MPTRKESRAGVVCGPSWLSPCLAMRDESLQLNAGGAAYLRCSLSAMQSICDAVYLRRSLSATQSICDAVYLRRSLFATVAVLINKNIALLLLKADKHKEHHAHDQQSSGNDLAHQWRWDHATLGHA